VLLQRKPEEPVEISMTPIIDMVFLLLIFFLVATKFADVERDVRVHPPSSRHARPITEVPQEIVINVDRDGRFLVAGTHRELPDIERLLQTATSTNPHQAVVIRGDRAAVLQAAVEILDLCEKYHIERTYLTTRQTEG
jgi:biopolymer transport protein ExbD